MIYIICPWGNATGGTELLHQLGYTLNLLGFETCIYYILERPGVPACHPYFEQYKLPRATTIMDVAGNIVIFPELVAKFFGKDITISNAKKVLWWLSVDNAEMDENSEQELINDNSIIHLVQSYYALDYVRNTLKVDTDRLHYLSDYINVKFLEKPSDELRDNIVLFNPRKGFEVTSKIIENSSAVINWKALNGIAPQNVPYFLNRAKVYIDFGNHPGKDRFPREAAMCGCRVITGKKGAAKFSEDVPIPAKYKFDDDDIEGILNQIYYLLSNYEDSAKDYKNYIEKIEEEFHVFEIDVFKVFHCLTQNNIETRSQEQIIDSIIDMYEKGCLGEAYYYIVLYRVCGFDVDMNYMMLECYVRLALNQIQMARAVARKALRVCEDAEFHLIMARSYLGESNEAVSSEVTKALEVSKGTDIELYVVGQAKEILSSISLT